MFYILILALKYQLTISTITTSNIPTFQGRNSSFTSIAVTSRALCNNLLSVYSWQAVKKQNFSNTKFMLQ